MQWVHNVEAARRRMTAPLRRYPQFRVPALANQLTNDQAYFCKTPYTMDPARALTTLVARISLVLSHTQIVWFEFRAGGREIQRL